MIVARRLPAATLALVLAFFPVALERCRTACVTAGQPLPQVPAPTHSCHDSAPSVEDSSDARMDPVSRACGHSDDTRAYESVSLVADKLRTAVTMPAVVVASQKSPAGD